MEEPNQINDQAKWESASMNELLERVERGARFMDIFQPDWYVRVDTDYLDLSHPRECVLGQLYGSFGKGLAAIRASDWGMDSVRSQIDWSFNNGFSDYSGERYGTMTELWREQVRSRKLQDRQIAYPTVSM